MDLAQVLDLDTHDERAVRANGNLDLGLERLEDRSWQLAVPVPQEILYCVPPNTTLERKRREVDVAPLPGAASPARTAKTFGAS